MLSYIRKTLYKCKHIQCFIHIFRTLCSLEIEEIIMRMLFSCQRLRHQLMALPIELLKEKSAHMHQCVKIKLEDWGYSSLVGLFISKTRNGGGGYQRKIWSDVYTSFSCIGELWLALLVWKAYSWYVCIAVPGYHTVQPRVFGSSSFQTNKGRQTIQCESLLRLSVLVN